MKALIVVDAQNEFSAQGHRPVPDYEDIIAKIKQHVQQTREQQVPIAWIQHHNKPNESPAFLHGSWGAELASGLQPELASPIERLFQKNEFGAFTGTGLEDWLRTLDVDEVFLVGFFTHMCLSTSAREAMVRGFGVSIDRAATGARDVVHPLLGVQTAEEVKRTALLQLSDMGAEIVNSGQLTEEMLAPLTA